MAPPVRRVPWPENVARPLVSPLQPSAVYVTDWPDVLDDQYAGALPGYTYAREGHPNADVVAAMIDRLEGVSGGNITGSGMAAITAALLGPIRAGDHVLGGDQLYGRSLRLLTETLPAMGIEASTVDATDLASVKSAIRPETRLILIEVVSNPTIRLSDVEGIAALCRDHGILLAVDNTFTTPLGFSAGQAGADIIVHSVTKLLAGHSDVTLGYVAARDPEIANQIRTLCITMGLTPSPFDCWLAERGLMSFEMRFERADANATRLADALDGMPGVRKVLYPGHASHPDRDRARRLLGNRGGHMLSIEIDGDRDAVTRVVAAMPEVAFAPTLG
ncbi:MAG: aminotransferase class V-fold PLP-dependent enzyme, partial [Pseudomonadota bacterium]